MISDENHEQEEDTPPDENSSFINDVRGKADFRAIGFSEFKKSDIKNALTNALVHAKYEAACYWSAELVCAGHFDLLWEIIIVFFYKYIHVSNPKLCIYLKMRWIDFNHIMNGYAEMELSARNNPKIRRNFCQIVCILCGSNKNYSMNLIKLNHADFDVDEMQEKLCAKEVIYINELFRPEDPRELFMAYNEFVFYLGNTNLRNACYWMEWIMEFEQKVIFEKNVCKCERRRFPNIDLDPKYQTDIVWMIWDAFFTEASEKKNAKLIETIVSACLVLFTNKYTSGCYKKYKCMMYFLVQILTDSTMSTMYVQEIISNKSQIEYFVKNISYIYAQIKQNEHSPNTEYLYTNITQSNLEQTVANLEMMNKMGESYIPRTM
ncbi:hypothetical protein N9K75_00765 [bacterium]|nr:hypothetical protein [bacterium]